MRVCTYVGVCVCMCVYVYMIERERDREREMYTCVYRQVFLAAMHGWVLLICHIIIRICHIIIRICHIIILTSAYCRKCSLATECVPLLRMCSLTIEYVF